MKKIKPCPFCGAEAKLRKIASGYGVKCTRCKATWRVVYKEECYTTPCMTQNVAIEAWNKRVE